MFYRLNSENKELYAIADFYLKFQIPLNGYTEGWSVPNLRRIGSKLRPLSC